VFPYTHHGVALFPQGTAYSVVATPVLVDFSKPEGAPIFRHIPRAVLATMPKAAVNEYSQHVLWEKEIRFANHLVRMFHPAPDLMAYQNIFNGDFC
jgi:hypothetical protein